MSWMDLLRMSSNNLRRRKLRTFLTVLGVVIGTASIVVMVSLGLGMQQAMYQEIEEYGGLKTISVYSSDSGEMMYGDSSAGSSESSDEVKYIDDDCIEELKTLEHAASVQPVYMADALALKGSYESYLSLVAMTPEGLAGRKIKLESGRLPAENSSKLELVFGNQVITSFYEKGSGNGYWETGELPNIDLSKDSMFLILDQENYNSSQGSIPLGDGGAEGGGDAGNTDGAAVSAKKHVVQSCGLVAGGIESWNANSYQAFCDLATLKRTLQKEFGSRVIPGQPQTKSGKPLKKFCYSYAELVVDDVDNVVPVANQLREMGYHVETNAESMESMEREMAIVEAVLGGIGAVSLFVAAIGIANTMMMSIYERTKEIGVMKVLGCSLKNIRQMFLLEAGFIGLFGGIVGNILSFLMSLAINTIAGRANLMDGAKISYIPFLLVAASIGFAILVGVLAGYMPAKRAMKLSPLEAIRNN